MFPSMTKQNMRYRGPMESEKINRFAATEAHDAYRLSVALDNIRTRIITLREIIKDPFQQTALDQAKRRLEQVKGAIS